MNKDLPLFSLKNRNAAVIGAGAGIGKAVAVACAAQGAKVTCLDRDFKAARKVADRINATGSEADAATLDVRDFKAVMSGSD